MAHIQLAGSVRCHVTTPPNVAPYIPDFVVQMVDGDAYLYGQFRRVWSPAGQAYGTPEGWMVQFNGDGTWERYDLGPPYRLICGGTWTYV